ncbi:MAG: hypothetical protein K9H49_15490, partial [Bacteroidales bacterium]|nr:hypothetical protein [Bacteroidales bacterium]
TPGIARNENNKTGLKVRHIEAGSETPGIARNENNKTGLKVRHIKAGSETPGIARNENKCPEMGYAFCIPF